MGNAKVERVRQSKPGSRGGRKYGGDTCLCRPHDANLFLVRTAKYTLHAAGQARVQPSLRVLMVGLGEMGVVKDGGVPLWRVNEGRVSVNYQIACQEYLIELMIVRRFP